MKDASRRLVVVSPHLDDAVLSLGASIARATRRGARVEILTVLAGDPASEHAPGGWDARGGFSSEGQAARARRDEDRAACAELAAVPVWLPFGSVDYERGGDEGDVHAAVLDAVRGADAALLPGAPLTHPDHAWLVGVLIRGELPCRRLGFYVEQPYATRSDGEPAVAGWLAELVGQEIAFMAAPASARDWAAKRRALRCYRSQLPLLGLSGRGALVRFLWNVRRSGGEAAGWLAGGSAEGRT